MSRRVDFDGISSDEVLEFSDADLDDLVFTDEAIVFRSGSAEVLGLVLDQAAHLKRYEA